MSQIKPPKPNREYYRSVLDYDLTTLIDAMRHKADAIERIQNIPLDKQHDHTLIPTLAYLHGECKKINELSFTAGENIQQYIDYLTSLRKSI